MGPANSPEIFRILSAWFLVTNAVEASLPTEIQKGGGIHTFLGRLNSEAALVHGLAGLTVLGVDQDGGVHILHSLFSVPVGPYGPDRWLFGWRRKLTLEGIPEITEILVNSFAAHRGVSAMLQEDHIVHLEGVSPSNWQTTPCERSSRKAKVRNLAFRGLNFLSPDAAALLIHLEENVADFLH